MIVQIRGLSRICRKTCKRPLKKNRNRVLLIVMRVKYNDLKKASIKTWEKLRSLYFAVAAFVNILIRVLTKIYTKVCFVSRTVKNCMVTYIIPWVYARARQISQEVPWLMKNVILPEEIWRRRPDSNRGMTVLQTASLPLGYVALYKLIKNQLRHYNLILHLLSTLNDIYFTE